MKDEKDRSKPRESQRRLRHNFRLARLLQFLELVSGRGRWNVRSLVKELEVSERTVHRLRETLELAGVPIYFDKEDSCYRVRSSFRFPPLNVTEEEAFAAATASSMESSQAFHLDGRSKSVIRKLADASDHRLSSIFDDVRRFTLVADLKIAESPRQQEFIRTIQRALASRVTVDVVYRSPYEKVPLAVSLHPYRLVFIKQAWYLIARPDHEEAPRTFRIVRFESIKLSTRHSTLPEDFDLDAYLGNAWSVYRGDATYEVKLRFSADAAPMVLEHRWHHTQKSIEHESGEVTLSFTVDGLNEIVRWVVGWAGQVSVIRPEELRRLVVDRHRKAVQLNEGKT